MIQRIIVAKRGMVPLHFKIFNLETADIYLPLGDNPQVLALLHDPVTEVIVPEMPEGEFLEVMYHNGVIDPEQEVIRLALRHLGISIEAAKVGHRYYDSALKGITPNKLVHMWFRQEPMLTTLKPRGKRQGMQIFDLISMNDQQLRTLSETRDLQLNLDRMRQLAVFQKRLALPAVTDVFLEVFAARWSDHCNHDKWEALGLFNILKEATRRIGNLNLISAYVDNAGGWNFFGDLVITLKNETHNSPSENEPYGGQLTKLGGVIRDTLAFGLGALPIGSIEMTVLGEFIQARIKFKPGTVLPAQIKAMETIKAIADYGNPMGIPMMTARMLSHPNFGSKCFALGGSVGIAPKRFAHKENPRPGDLVLLLGGDTGNDGIHGATISSGEMSEQVDTGDASHVQIGHPFTEQKMMPCLQELRLRRLIRSINDFGAAGIPSAVMEMSAIGVLVNLGLVPLKCLDLENFQITISESQERMALAIDPRHLRQALKICSKYQLKATVIGVFTGNGRAQLVYDPEVTEFTANTPLSGEICFDVPYSFFKDCPPLRIEVIDPPAKIGQVEYPAIALDNVEEMALKVVGHFNACNQTWATQQYDAEVQGRTYQGPLVGRNYNIPSALSVLRPVYGKNWGLTLSLSFLPWQFEVDPVQAAINAMMDAVIAHVGCGVKLRDICLADNFYTPNLDPYAYWYLREQVRAIAEFSVALGTPFITGKDSSSGSSTKGGVLVNVLPSVAVTAMGKIRDARRLILQTWKQPGNLLFAIGQPTQRLDGSILSSALDITGSHLDGVSITDARLQANRIERIIASGIVRSSVPINQGGLMLRLFEGAEASGLGIETDLCAELFPESMGSILVEVSPLDAKRLHRLCADMPVIPVGTITSQASITVQGQELDWLALHYAWNTTFRTALGVSA